MRIIADYENSHPPLTNPLVNMMVELRIPDQFLVIDGKMINYLEYRGAPQATIHTEDITMPNGAPARVYKLEGRQHFLDKNFYVAAIDTVYQFAPGTRAFAPINSQAQTKPTASGSSVVRQQAASTSNYDASPLRKRPYVEYGGAPRGLKVPPMRVGY
jgi:hypothetical protein